MFLVVLALGNHSSQLYTFTHQLAWAVLYPHCSQMSLAPSPHMLAKNECEGHCLDLVVFLAWTVDGHPHPLCPVNLLQTVIQVTQDAPMNYLFVWPDSLHNCSKMHITSVFWQVTQAVDLGQLSLAQDIHKFTVTLALFLFSPVTSPVQVVSS